MSKENAILFGPIVGEFGWEHQRFAPLLPYMKRKKYKKKKIKCIILTREERFDLYGKYADILVPLRIPGDYEKYMPNCYRLDDFPLKEYEKIAQNFYNKYSKTFNILGHLYPKVKKKQFLQKNQFPQSQMTFEYAPRQRNYELIDDYLPKSLNKPIVILAPRYRNNVNDPKEIRQRNWPKWQELYDILVTSELWDEFTFVICGKKGEYIPDKKDRFYDITKIQVDQNSSLVGLLLVLLDRAVLTCGSQSAIPNLSLLNKVEVLEFGHQKTLHARTYNVFSTKVTFLDDPRYQMKSKIILKNLKKLLNNKKGIMK